MTTSSEGTSRRRPAHFWWVATAAAVATAVLIGAPVSGGGDGAAGFRGSLAGVGAAYGGPAAQPSSSAERMAPTAPDSGPTPGIACDEGSKPETIQGKAPKADYGSGRAAEGYFCNARLVSHSETSGGYRVERYVDAAGHECAYWDSTLLWPHNQPEQGTEGPGTYVMDMTDPANPVHTDTLRTQAITVINVGPADDMNIGSAGEGKPYPRSLRRGSDLPGEGRSCGYLIRSLCGRVAE